MKYLIFVFIATFLSMTAFSQDVVKKNRKEIRAEKEAKKKEAIKQLINSGDFVFQATHALPLGGGSIFLNHDYDVRLKNDSVFSYLPFYGVAYHLEYGGRDGGFIFDEEIKEFSNIYEKENHLIKFEVKRGNDNIYFTFHITDLGYATLNISSTNRQAISYYGYLEENTDE